MNKKQIKKNVNSMRETRFAYELTPYGSLVSSLLLVTNQKWSDAKYVRLFNRATFPYLDDEDFVGKTLRAVGLRLEDFKGETIGVYRDPKGFVMFSAVAPVELVMKDGLVVKKILPLPISYKKDFFPNTIRNNIDSVELMTL